MSPNKNLKTCFHAADEVQVEVYFFFQHLYKLSHNSQYYNQTQAFQAKKYQPDFLHTDLITSVFEGIQTELFNCCCLWIFVFPVCVQNDDFYQFGI